MCLERKIKYSQLFKALIHTEPFWAAVTTTGAKKVSVLPRKTFGARVRVSVRDYCPSAVTSNAECEKPRLPEHSFFTVFPLKISHLYQRIPFFSLEFRCKNSYKSVFRVKIEWEQGWSLLHCSPPQTRSLSPYRLRSVICSLLRPNPFFIFHSDISLPAFLSLPAPAWC